MEEERLIAAGLYFLLFAQNPCRYLISAFSSALPIVSFRTHVRNLSFAFLFIPPFSKEGSGIIYIFIFSFYLSIPYWKSEI
jgi:hypothetical protein